MGHREFMGSCEFKVKNLTVKDGRISWTLVWKKNGRRQGDYHTNHTGCGLWMVDRNDEQILPTRLFRLTAKSMSGLEKEILDSLDW